MDEFVATLADEAALRAALPTEGATDLTVLDCELGNALSFSQGSWDLVVADLTAAGLPRSLLDELEAGPCATVIDAFDLRRELVNYKKVLLHLFSECRRIDADLQRVLAHTFWQHSDVVEDMVAHLSAAFDGDAATERELEKIKAANGLGLTVQHQKLLYVVSTKTMMRHRGVQRAIHDARDILKAICLTPRHPEGRLPRRLREMPRSLYVNQALTTALAASTTLGRKQGKAAANASNHGGDDEASRDLEGSATAPNTGELGVGATEAGEADEVVPLAQRASREPLDRVLSAVRDALGWPAQAVAFVEQCLIARGGFKALAMSEELRRYVKILQELLPQISGAADRFRAAEEVARAKWHARPSGAKKTPVSDLEDWLSAAAFQGRQIAVLSGIESATAEHTRWVQELLARFDAHSSAGRDSMLNAEPRSVRLFVAGDDVRQQQSCAFVPRDFQLGEMATAPRSVLKTFLMPAMDAAIVHEGWPPSIDGCRTRVRAYSHAHALALGDKLPRSARHRCADCHGTFDSIWVREGVCAVCIKKRRADCSGSARCIFECKLAEQAWCPHSTRCFVCDAPHSCEIECRLGRGDGESVCAAVKALQPEVLCLDFDKTLCTTRNGGTPLPKSGRVKHTIDSELKAAALLHPFAHVITRNSHKADIEAFLRQEGLAEMAVHVVPKKMPKGQYIHDTFYSSDRAVGACLFVDDDIRELVLDPWLRTDQRIHRIHFVRAL